MAVREGHAGGGADHPAPLQRRLPGRLPRPRRANTMSASTATSPNRRSRSWRATSRYGTSLAAHMDELGLVNERFTVAHGVWLDDEDMKRLGDRGASVAHNPGSNMRLGNGLADVRGMLNRKVNVGVGTDGASCSDNQNMYEAMRLASFAPRYRARTWQQLAHHRRGAAGGHRRQRPCARPGKADRQDRAGLQGRHRLPRPAPHQLDPDQRSGERAGPHRGRHRRAFGHDRRPHGGREPQAPDRRPRPSSPPRPRQSRRGARRSPRRRRSSIGRWRRSSAPSAPASPRHRCTSIAMAPVITHIEGTGYAYGLAGGRSMG